MEFQFKKNLKTVNFELHTINRKLNKLQFDRTFLSGVLNLLFQIFQGE